MISLVGEDSRLVEMKGGARVAETVIVCSGREHQTVNLGSGGGEITASSCGGFYQSRVFMGVKVYHITVLIILVLPSHSNTVISGNLHYCLFAPLRALPFFIPWVHEGDMGDLSFTKEVEAVRREYETLSLYNRIPAEGCDAIMIDSFRSVL